MSRLVELQKQLKDAQLELDNAKEAAFKAAEAASKQQEDINNDKKEYGFSFTTLDVDTPKKAQSEVARLTTLVAKIEAQIEKEEKEVIQIDVNTPEEVNTTPTNHQEIAKIVGSVIIGLIAGAVAGYFLLPVFAALLATVASLAVTATSGLVVAAAVGAGSYALMSMFSNTVGGSGAGGKVPVVNQENTETLGTPGTPGTPVTV
jgi:ATPase subunit of ABC transporter with duplicated ATPase domains